MKTSLGGEQRINTGRYEMTGRGGKGHEVIKRGTLHRGRPRAAARARRRSSERPTLRSDAAWPPRPTPPKTSRSSKASTRSASARACTSAASAAPGLHHLVWEIVDNSVDEAMNGHADGDRGHAAQGRSSVTVTDNGRGIPVDNHPKHKKPALEIIFSTLHAGGKFEGDNYKTSGGLHGVGASVVNALSTKLVATVKRDGAEWQMEFKRGERRRAS